MHHSSHTEIPALQALAWGLLDGGLEIITNFPGFHSQELFALCGGTQTSVNEKTAYAVAWGAACGGSRAAVTLKNVGLNDAYDPFLNSLLLGIRAGLVIVVFDDVEVAGSQCRLDSRHAFDVFGGLWLEPADAGQAYALARKAFDWSERFQIPVVLRVTNALLRQQGRVSRQASRATGAPLLTDRPDPEQFVVHPVYSRAQRARLAERQTTISAWVEDLYSPQNKCVSAACLRVRVGAPTCEAASAPDIQLFTYPLPTVSLRAALAGAREIHVEEQGDGYVQEKLLAIGSKLMVRPAVAGESSAGETPYRIDDSREALFGGLRAVPGRLVCGDLGTFTLDSHRTIDACLCLGTSVGIGVGMATAAKKQPVFVVTGDAAFFHSGQAALAEALARKLDLTVLILDNGGSQATGGQRTPQLVNPSGGITWHFVDDDPVASREIGARFGPRPGSGLTIVRLNIPH